MPQTRNPATLISPVLNPATAMHVPFYILHPASNTACWIGIPPTLPHHISPRLNVRYSTLDARLPQLQHG
eukprot:3185574-Rhodomonas_salina.5